MTVHPCGDCGEPFADDAHRCPPTVHADRITGQPATIYTPPEDIVEVRTSLSDAARVESPVCPYCGMTTWFHGSCALPGCDGHSARQELADLREALGRQGPDALRAATYWGRLRKAERALGAADAERASLRAEVERLSHAHEMATERAEDFEGRYEVAHDARMVATRAMEAAEARAAVLACPRVRGCGGPTCTENPGDGEFFHSDEPTHRACAECLDEDGEPREWPCPTARILDAVPADTAAAKVRRVEALADLWEEATVWPDKPDRPLRGAAARLRIALADPAPEPVHDDSPAKAYLNRLRSMRPSESMAARIDEVEAEIDDDMPGECTCAMSESSMWACSGWGDGPVAEFEWPDEAVETAAQAVAKATGWPKVGPSDRRIAHRVLAALAPIVQARIEQAKAEAW